MCPIMWNFDLRRRNPGDFGNELINSSKLLAVPLVVFMTRILDFRQTVDQALAAVIKCFIARPDLANGGDQTYTRQMRLDAVPNKIEMVLMPRSVTQYGHDSSLYIVDL